MTPAARVQTAIELLDRIFEGAPAEKVLTGWARQSRYAGSKDRAAVRDHVYTALRCRNSAARMGGGLNGRAVMLGLLTQQGVDLAPLFSGADYAPKQVSSEESAVLQAAEAADPVEDIPKWMQGFMRQSLGDDYAANAQAMRERAPVFLRVNLQKTTRENAAQLLKQDGVLTRPHPLAVTALQVTEGDRRVNNSQAYRSGLIELQDVSSQAAMQCLPLSEGSRVLDFCAGGGGKTLAMAGLCRADFFAHDANPARMRDISKRAQRAGVSVSVKSLSDLKKQPAFDIVLCDAPCSGSGTWRRTPDAKWRLSDSDLQSLNATQDEILNIASTLVAPGGVLAYATCSLFECENSERIKMFMDGSSGWSVISQHHWNLAQGSDGFFLAQLQRV